MKPTAGARFVVTRAEDTREAMVYRGVVELPDGDLALEVTVARSNGACAARVGGAASDARKAALEKQAAALVRAATKSAVVEGVDPPRKIVRWRG